MKPEFSLQGLWTMKDETLKVQSMMVIQYTFGQIQSPYWSLKFDAYIYSCKWETVSGEK